MKEQYDTSVEYDELIIKEKQAKNQRRIIDANLS